MKYTIKAQNANCAIGCIKSVMARSADAEIAGINDELTRLRAENERLRNALLDVVHYWNRDENERAMSDALWHIVDVAGAAIDAAMGGDKPAKDRASPNPGGCECLECGVIFIGGPEHDRCGICAAMGGEGEG